MAALSLRAWLTIILTLVVLVVELASIGVFVAEMQDAAETATRDRPAMSLLWAARAIEDAPPEIHDKIPSGFAQPNGVMFLQDEPAVAADVADPETAAWAQVIADWLRQGQGLSFRELRIGSRTVYLPGKPPEPAVRTPPPAILEGIERPRIALPGFADGRTPMWLKRPADFVPDDPDAYLETRAFVYALQLEDGRWLNFYALPRLVPRGSIAFKIAAAIAAAVIAFIAALVLGRWLTAPLTQLTAAAERLGRGEPVETLPAKGTRDLRRVTEAFNTMGERVAQAVGYQAGIIQSLGHDLRGPLSHVQRRLAGARIEEADRAALQAHLAQAQAILDPIVQYSQSTLRDGPFEETDIVALAQAVAEPFNEATERVSIDAPASLFLRTRFGALRRLIANLVENAVKYAGSVRVSIRTAGEMVILRFDDDGPGVPEDALDEVFRPFRRRNSDLAGSGLGLAIARSIAVDHGGTITLQNGPERGFTVEVRLPR